MTAIAWVVGRGGLLGRHVAAALKATGTHVWDGQSVVPWDDAHAAGTAVELDTQRFLAAAVHAGAPWRIAWCAGAGVVATSAETLAQETVVFTHFVGALHRGLERHPGLAHSGTLFFSSSAGGVYAASDAEPPFDESDPPRALAPYGEEKLIQELLVAQTSEALGADLIIGRFSNLYGPGQNLSKPQGLIAHVGWAALRRQPIAIYVPLDTIRDYLYAPDAARMVAAVLDRRAGERAAGAPAATSMKVFASEVETTVASVLATWRQVLHRPLRVTLAATPVAQLQPRVLSFRSRVWQHVRFPPTPLLLGIDALRRDQLARLGARGIM